MSTAISECRKIRGNAKGTLTRTATNVAHNMTLPAHSLDESSVNKMREALLRADDVFQIQHQMLHVELEDLPEEAFLTQLREHQTAFTRALSSTNTLLARIAYSKRLTLVETSLAVLESVARDGYTPQLLVKLPDTETCFSEYLSASAVPFLSEEEHIPQSRKVITERLSTIVQLCEPHRAPAASHPSATSTPTATIHANDHLKVTLPTFDGQLRHWRAFWDCFHSLMQSNSHLTSQQKRTFLVKAMDNPDAKARAQQALACTDSYEDAVKKMKYTYEDTIELHRHHVSQIFKATPYQNNKQSLSSLLGMLEENTAGMRATNGYTAEHIVASHVYSLLPPTMQSKWKERVGKATAPPTQTQLEDFLKDMIHASPDTLSVVSIGAPASIEPPITVSHAGPLTRTSTRTSQPKKPMECRMCSADHSIFTCSKMLDMSVPSRLQWAIESKACLNCFNTNHSTDKCASSNRCKVCQQAHHTLIHQSLPSASEPSALVVSQLPSVSLHAHSPVTVPFTASLRARAHGITQMGRAHFDTGASVTLVTRDFAQKLRARKIPHSGGSVKGVFASLQTLYQIKFTLFGSPKLGCGHQSLHLTAHVVESIPPPSSQVDMDAVRSLPFLKDLPLADSKYYPGDKIDILLELAAVTACGLKQSTFSHSSNLEARKTIFGWTVGGSFHPPRAHHVPTACFVTTLLSSPASAPPLHDADSDHLIRTFWDSDPPEPQRASHMSDDDTAVLHFLLTHTRDPTGRYWVKLPRHLQPPVLGASFQMAFKRFLANEKSLRRKGTLQLYQAAVQEYLELGHAELVPSTDLNKPDSQHYYLPMHGVAKVSSTSTKLRPVCDASAKSSTGASLNDQLLTGPATYPTICSMINRLRSHRVVLVADISKMYRQVGLHHSERDFHRFLHRDAQDVIRPYRMTRLTFGVSCSPFVATRVLRQAATDHQDEFPRAAAVLRTSFYVDDLLTGADSVQDAQALRSEMNSLLDRACMPLCKWRSNSQQLLDSIPSELRETTDPSASDSISHSLKLLGIHWDSTTDNFFIAVPDVSHHTTASKRAVASVYARLFDPLGWFGPATMPAKILIQKSWDRDLDWDSPLPPDLRSTWDEWILQIPQLHSHAIPRPLNLASDSPVSTQLHGFCDASNSAFGAVVYSRQLHPDTLVSVQLISSRSKVAPLDGQTIPRLELAGALLLAELLSTTAADFSIPPSCIFAWTDSAIVLGWLNRDPSSQDVFVANRVRKIVSLLPATNWRYVATHLNPADVLSRGTSPAALCQHHLWWHGPKWLSLQPAEWPRRKDINLSRELPEVGPPVISIVQPGPQEVTTHTSHFSRLVRVFGWINRFISRTRRLLAYTSRPTLSLEELRTAKVTLFKHSQHVYYHTEISLLAASKPLPKRNRLRSLAPFLDDVGLLRVGGRLQQSHLSTVSQHPLILHRHSHTVQIMLRRLHVHLRHAGSSTMMAAMSGSYYIQRVKPFLKSVIHHCPRCLRRAAQTSQTLMGQLPASRVCPSPPFSHVGIDFAGPFLIRRGHTRKPLLVKTYLCLFICFSTKAVHLEVASDMTTATFIACLVRFTGRRGTPSHIYTDNGSNFLGAEPIIAGSPTTSTTTSQEAITAWAAYANVAWSFSPPKGPHHGGLWEAGVKSMKALMGTAITNGLLTYEELVTLSVEVEAIMNSRPLAPLDTMPEDSIDVLTPGHFLVGRPLKALPFHHDFRDDITLLRRWNLVERLTHDLWTRWHQEYIQTLQTRSKWQEDPPPLRPGDVVMVKDTFTFKRDWPLAIITATCPGPDGRVRVVQLRSGTTMMKRPVTDLVKILSPGSPGEDVEVAAQPQQCN